MSNYRTIIIYGLALFAMFFGSGNIVFPIAIGKAAGEYWFLGFLGLLITGIFLPFCGLFVVKLHKGDYHSFFAEGGKIAKFVLPLFTLSLLGAFGVVPRCITVAYGGIRYIYKGISLEVFSILFSIAIFFFCMKDQRMINIIGKWMSPILIISLIVLIFTGVMNQQNIKLESSLSQVQSFEKGFFVGYQLMDLFAAFFFSALIFSHIQKSLPKNTKHIDVVKFAIKPSIIGASILAIIYMGFVFLGAHFADLIKDVEPEFMLPIIARNILGKYAALFIGTTMLFSCLTTAVALNNIYSRYLHKLFNLKEDKFPYILSVTTLISLVISTFDFNGIASFIGPLLEISYPSVIALTIFSIITLKFRKFKIVLFYGILGVMILMRL